MNTIATTATTKTVMDPWQSRFQSNPNAWDEVPEIRRYIRFIQRPRWLLTTTTTTTNGSGSGSGGGSRSRTATAPVSAGTYVSVGTQTADEQNQPQPQSRCDCEGDSDSDRGVIGSGETAPVLVNAHIGIIDGVPTSVQEDWMGVTVDVFLQLLRISYLFWRVSGGSSSGSSRGVSSGPGVS